MEDGPSTPDSSPPKFTLVGLQQLHSAHMRAQERGQPNPEKRLSPLSARRLATASVDTGSPPPSPRSFHDPNSPRFIPRLAELAQGSQSGPLARRIKREINKHRRRAASVKDGLNHAVAELRRSSSPRQPSSPSPRETWRRLPEITLKSPFAPEAVAEELKLLAFNKGSPRNRLYFNDAQRAIAQVHTEKVWFEDGPVTRFYHEQNGEKYHLDGAYLFSLEEFKDPDQDTSTIVHTAFTAKSYRAHFGVEPHHSYSVQGRTVGGVGFEYYYKGFLLCASTASGHYKPLLEEMSPGFAWLLAESGNPYMVLEDHSQQQQRRSQQLHPVGYAPEYLGSCLGYYHSITVGDSQDTFGKDSLRLVEIDTPDDINLLLAKGRAWADEITRIHPVGFGDISFSTPQGEQTSCDETSELFLDAYADEAELGEMLAGLSLSSPALSQTERISVASPTQHSVNEADASSSFSREELSSSTEGEQVTAEVKLPLLLTHTAYYQQSSPWQGAPLMGIPQTPQAITRARELVRLGGRERASSEPPPAPRELITGRPQQRP